jgi:hypothetical protein
MCWAYNGEPADINHEIARDTARIIKTTPTQPVLATSGGQERRAEAKPKR